VWFSSLALQVESRVGEGLVAPVVRDDEVPALPSQEEHPQPDLRCLGSGTLPLGPGVMALD